MRDRISALVARAPARVRRALELCVRTASDAFDDRVPGLAAEVAFFMLLSLPPLLLLILGTVGYLGGAFPGIAEQTASRLADLAGNVLTDETLRPLVPVLRSLLTEGRGDIASLGVVLTIYSASRALRTIVMALTIAYDLEERHEGWRQRLWGLGLTVIGLVVGVVTVPVLVLGPNFGEVLRAHVDVPGLADVWRVGYWPAGALLATAMIASLYHFATPWTTPWRRDLPGAALAMVMWLAGSAGLRLYITGSSIGDEVFAPIAAPLVLLLWMYVSAFAVLIGAEFNAEIEKMWPTVLPGDAGTLQP